MAKLDEVLAYVKTLVGKGVDHDGYYGTQCVDLIMHLNAKFWNFRSHGNAIHYASNALPPGHKRYKRGETKVLPGDVLIWKWGAWDIYGHIGFCTATDGTNITSIEQNVDGNADSLTKGGPARYRTRNDACLVAIIRPNYEKSDLDHKTYSQYWTRVPEKGVFTVTVDKINIRREPSTKGEPVAYYEKGQSVKYDSYVVANGYVWISYVGTSGFRNFMAIGEHDGIRRTSVWGTFK